LRRAKPDLLHNLFNTAPAVRAVPQVTTIHDVIHERYPEPGALALGVKALVPLAARRSVRILTVSEASKTDIVRYLGIDASRIDVAPNGPGMRDDVVGPPPPEIRRRFELGEAPLLLTAAPNRLHKNVARLAEALAEIPEAILVVPGYEARRGDDLARITRKRGVAGRVRRPGWVDDATLDGLYRAADCFVFPSLAEGFGLPVLEAMLRGTPVACSNATSLPEVAGDAALFFDPLDVEAIVVSVRRILDDPELAERLAAAGRERARRFSWEESARRTFACYRRALASR
jgi:glycosyltransferase involved in cell wall biosynthesis